MKEEKLKKFLADEQMVVVVKEVIREVFMRPREKTDVQTLAAERIAINLLEEAWRELQRYKASTEKRPDRPPNMAV